MFQTKQLKEERQGLIEALRSIDGERQTRGDEATYTAEEKGKFDDLRKDIQQLDEKIATAERMEAIPAVEERHEADERHQTRGGYNGGLTRGDCESAIAGFLTRGTNHQTARQRAAMERAGVNPHSNELVFKLNAEQPTRRALEVATDSKGGYTVERYPINRLEKELLEYSGGLREVATIVRTPKGGDYPIPTLVDNDTAEDHLEHELVSESEVTFDETVIGCGTVDSKLIKISLELLQDSALNMDVQLSGVLSDRIAKFVSRRHVLGVSAPWDGLVKGAADSGVTFAGATPTYTELLTLDHGVPPAYRNSGSVAYMMNDATLLQMRLIADDNGHPIWQPDMRVGSPDRLLGRRVIYCPDMPDGQVIYGDFSKFIIREVQDIVVRRLDQVYLDSLAVGFLAYYRGGCKVVDVSGKALVKADVASA